MTQKYFTYDFSHKNSALLTKKFFFKYNLLNRPIRLSQKYFTYDVTHKKPHTPGKNFFFECNLLDWPIRLRRWTAL